LYDLVFGVGSQKAVVVELQVAVPHTILTERTGGELEGYGPITDTAIRELLSEHTVMWRRVITDPVGKVLEVSRRRHPGTDLARHIRLRDKTCRFPGCHRAARSCDLDHTVEYSQGGTTSPGNVACLCPFHHKLKDRPGWSLCQSEPGHLTWTTPTGGQYQVAPEPLVEYAQAGT